MLCCWNALYSILTAQLAWAVQCQAWLQAQSWHMLCFEVFGDRDFLYLIKVGQLQLVLVFYLHQLLVTVFIVKSNVKPLQITCWMSYVFSVFDSSLLLYYCCTLCSTNVDISTSNFSAHQSTTTKVQMEWGHAELWRNCLCAIRNYCKIPPLC